MPIKKIEPGEERLFERVRFRLFFACHIFGSLVFPIMLEERGFLFGDIFRVLHYLSRIYYNFQF